MNIRWLAGLFALWTIGAAPLRPASPMKLIGYLTGRWNCSSTVGRITTRYTAEYSYALGGKWMRTINTSAKSQSEDMMTYVNHGWTVIDMEPTGTMSVLTAPDTGLAHIALTTRYPKPGLSVTYDRVSMTKYTLTFAGTFGGKPAHWVDTCTKV
jgi:hypothetical protein